jgi:predicted RNA-binding Zn-ribbon protein involved in translation (DUF1610 family)
MPEGKLFNCPSCGAALESQANRTEIKCPYCGNTVGIPQELRQTAITASPATTRWIKIGIWMFVILMIVTFVLPFVCSICGVLAGMIGAFVPFFVK